MLNNLLVLQAALAGAVLPLQAALNATVARGLGHPVSAAITNFTVGLVALVTLAIALRIQTPTSAGVSTLSWYHWIGGGLCGAFYVFTALFVAPRIGVTALLAGALAGQLIASLIMDHFGLLGLQSQPISPGRMVGVVLLIAGVFLVRRY